MTRIIANEEDLNSVSWTNSGNGQRHFERKIREDENGINYIHWKNEKWEVKKVQSDIIDYELFKIVDFYSEKKEQEEDKQNKQKKEQEKIKETVKKYIDSIKPGSGYQGGYLIIDNENIEEVDTKKELKETLISIFQEDINQSVVVETKKASYEELKMKV